MKTLKITKENIPLPRDIVTQTIAILAKRRAGKSYTMRKLCEELLEAHEQIIIVDPKGDQWGIRSSADGKKPGYPIVILGGEHGDAPLEVNAGEVVAKLVVEERVSILLDLSVFRKHEIATFMTAFLESLYRLKAQEKYRTPVMLVIDEADAIAPQKPQQNEARMLGAAEDIVRRGGQRGIGCSLITQRSAVLNKNVLTQAQMLIVLRTIAPQDLSAMKAWIDVHGTIEEGKELMDSLPSLPIGDAWFWSPGWPTEAGIFQRSHILPIKTFDSGATPKPGEKKVIPKNLADVDLEALKKQMSATIEKAKNDDPKILKKRISELEALVKILEKPSPAFKSVAEDVFNRKLKEVEKEVEKRMNIEFMAERDEFIKHINSMFKVIKIVGETVKDIKLPDIKKRSGVTLKYKEILVDNIVPANITLPEKEIVKAVDTDFMDTNGNTVKPMSKCARSILSYLHISYPSEKSKTQLWIATGYAPGGGFDNAVAELTSQGFVIKTEKGFQGRGEHYPIGPIDQSFDPSVEKWDNKLSLCSRKIFHLLLEDPSISMTKKELAETTGYALGGGFDNGIAALTNPRLIKKQNDKTYTINLEVLDL